MFIPKAVGFISESLLDEDAGAFIQVTGISNGTQKYAIDRLVKDLKESSLWSKFQALYPIVGGTITTHKYNLIDPQDTDAAFRLTFSLGWTHDSNGMTPNGTSSFTNTHFIPETIPTGNLVSRDDAHFSLYSRTNAFGGGANQSKVDLGSTDGSAIILQIRPANGLLPHGPTFQFDRTPQYIDAIPPISDTLGLFTLSRESNVELYAYQDNTSVGSYLGTHHPAEIDNEIFLGASNVGLGATNFSNRQLAFASIGTSLTSAQLSSFYTIVQDYQTTLGREV